MAHAPPMPPFFVAMTAVGLLSLMDAVMKHAALAEGTYVTLVVRSVIALAIAAPLYVFRRKGWPAPAVLRLHVIRGAVIAGMAFTFFWSITKLPLAEAIALSFTSPLVALYLAAVTLRERIGQRALNASLLGFAGVVVIGWARMEAPATDAETVWGIASALTSSLLYAWNLVLQRQQALVAGPAEIATFQSGVAGLVYAVFVPWFFTPPAVETLPWIAAAAAMSVGGSMLFAWAYRRAETQALVPLEYSGFLWAALFGWIFFTETVTLPTLAGAVLIVAGCWIAAPRKRPEQTQV